MVGFCVQRTGTLSCQLEMQMLQPMHSRMSCSRPSSILLRQERDRRSRAVRAPIRSSTPRRICPTMVSGEVKRPTPTTGLVVIFFTNSMIGSWLPSGAKRDGAQSVGEESSFTSQRSGSSASRPTTSCASDGRDRARSGAQLLEADAQRHRALAAAPPRA